jgi:hypothetical protein
MKKVREEIKFKGSGGLLDVFDDYVKGLYNITDAEYDFIDERVSDEEMCIFVSIIDVKKVSFSQKRKALEIRNKYLKQFNDERNN